MKRLYSTAWFWVLMGFVFGLVGAVGAWVRYKQPNVLLVWKPFIITQHQFDYELEFVKRGLVGEWFRLLEIERTIGAISLFSWLVLGLLAVALVRLYRIYDTSGKGADAEEKESSLWLWTVVLCPATFLQIGGDLGRLDSILLLCEIGLLAQVVLTGWFWFPVAVALTWLGVSTHELFLLAQFPVVVCAHLFIGWHQPERRGEVWGRGIAVTVAAVFAAVFVALWGRMESVSANEYIEFIRQRRGIAEPNEEGVAVLYKSLGSNIQYAWEQLARKAPWGIPCVAAVMLAYLGIAFAAVRWCKARMVLIGAAAAGPLLLLLLAYDYGRWFSFATVNILFALCVCQKDGKGTVDWKPLRWAWLFVLLGPFGVTIGFPWWL